nr:hypothetical protein [uncultured bacterium]
MRPAIGGEARRIQVGVRRAAFTLVEVVATIIVLAVIGSIASRTIITAMDSYVQASTQAQLHSELSIALDRIERELRKIPIKAGYGSIAPDISSVTSTSMAWSGNCSLSLSGDQLLLAESGEPAVILLDDVSAISIQAYDENNSALAANLSGTSCDPIRRVAIRITLQRAGVSETLGMRIFLRCTMEGAPVS